jgi:methionyl-tRNA formyltransferase
MPPLRLVFLGSDAIALPMLDFLADTGRALAEVVAVYTQPDRPHVRGQRLLPGPVKSWAIDHHVPVFQPERLGPEDTLRLTEFGTDVVLVMAYGQILKEDFIAAARRGTFNLHTSLLPKYRGASPVTAAIASGETETGVSFMRVVRQLDAGAVAAVERRPIGPRDTTATIEAAVGLAAAAVTERCLGALRDGTLHFTDQNETEASYCRRLNKEDGALDFAQPAALLARRINALMPWPGCSVDWSGVPLKFGLAEASSEIAEATPGAVLGADREALRIAAGQGVLRVLQLQRPGGKMLAAPEFLRGYPLVKGTGFPSHPMPPLVAAEPFRRY